MLLEYSSIININKTFLEVFGLFNLQEVFHIIVPILLLLLLSIIHDLVFISSDMFYFLTGSVLVLESQSEGQRGSVVVRSPLFLYPLRNAPCMVREQKFCIPSAKPSESAVPLHGQVYLDLGGNYVKSIFHQALFHISSKCIPLSFEYTGNKRCGH